MKKSTLFIILGAIICFAAGRKSKNQSVFSEQEVAIINSGNDTTLMYIYNTDNPSDTIVLRAKSYDIGKKEILSDNYLLLKARMLATVTHPTVDGVGIAAPQIGINRRIVAVQRFDKEGTPFEVYPNIHIEKLYGAIKNGREGCLSVPNRRGFVPRHDSVIVSYLNAPTLNIVSDTIGGYTAIIFQHEIDHLEGRLYTDICINTDNNTPTTRPKMQGDSIR